MKNKNKLSKLIVKEDLNTDVLFDILDKFLRIKEGDKKIILLPDFSKLKFKDAVLILLLGFKALKELGFIKNEMVGPKRIHDISGINLSTVKNSLRDLEGESIITSDKGKYLIPNFLLHTLGEKFQNLSLVAPRRTLAKKKRTYRIDLSKIEKFLKISPSNIFSEFYSFLTQERGNYLQKCLIVLNVAKDKFEIESLTTGEITYLLRDYIGVPMIHQPNISTALGGRDALKYIFKEVIDGGKYTYKLNAKGKYVVDQIVKKYQEDELKEY